MYFSKFLHCVLALCNKQIKLYSTTSAMHSIRICEEYFDKLSCSVDKTLHEILDNLCNFKTDFSQK